MPNMSAGSDPLFRLDHAGVSLGGHALLHPLSLDIPRGRVTGLIGHNGSGKSTLLRLLARQLTPTHGGIWFEGVPLSRWGGRPLARRLAYLPQTPPLAEGLRVRELVSLGRYPWTGALGRFGAEDRRIVDDAIRDVDLHARAEQFVATLSGGERQRAYLAMLLAQQSGSLLLDEPISALDVAHQIEVMRLIRTHATERQLSVVVVLHDVTLAVSFCDDIIALHSGRVIARDAAPAFMDAGRLREIYGIPMKAAAVEGLPFGICYPDLTPHAASRP